MGVPRLRPNDQRRFVKASIPPAWSGKTAVLIACGPSLNRRQINTVKSAFYAGACHVLVVNRAYEAAPFADAMYAADERFWDHYIPQVLDTHIPLLFCQDRAVSERHGLWWTPGPGDSATSHASVGLSEDPNVIHFGFHSGFQALNVVYHLRPARILLLGYDCRHAAGKRHFHEDHPQGWMNAEAPQNWIGPYEATVAQFRARGMQVFNCSPGSAIECFPRGAVGALL